MTGKVKEMFEKWLIKYIYPEHYYSVTYTVKQNGEKVYGTTALMGKDLKQIVEMFNILPFAMKQGVYLQFFRENGIFISVDECEGTVIFKARYTGNRYNGCLFTVKNSGYNTAFTQAIETACNILEGK